MVSIKVNYFHHLKKINDLNGTGSRIGLWRLAVAYNLRYFLCRPIVVGRLAARRYRARKKLFYTVITGSYDQLNDIPQRLPGWDYVCFTDNRALASSAWEIKFIDNRQGLDPARLSRQFKLNNHLVDGGYDLSVYADANLKIRGNLDAFVGMVLPDDAPIGLLLHPFLHNLADEVAECVAAGKADERLLRDQYAFYTGDQGFVDRLPHVNARMIIRRCGDLGVRRLMELWFEQILTWTGRDQVSFNYALSRCGDLSPAYIPYWIFRKYFKKMDHSSEGFRQGRGT